MTWKKITHKTKSTPAEHYSIHNAEWISNILNALRHGPIKPDKKVKNIHFAHLVLDHFDELKNQVDADWGKEEPEIYDDLSDYYDNLIDWHSRLPHNDNHGHNDISRSTEFLNSADALEPHLWDVDLERLLSENPPNNEQKN